MTSDAASWADQAAAALRAHPHVAAVKVVALDSAAPDLIAPDLIAYVVPAPAAYAPSDSVARDYMNIWRRVYDAMYERPPSDALWDIGCWRDSYRQEPIPLAEMVAWTQETVAYLLGFAPRRVLEIGCGSGLLLYRIAPHCEKFVGLDYSGSVIARLRADLAQRGEEFHHVEVYERSADELATVAGGPFDLIILNSVVMYFPTEDYLEKILAQAAGMVTPGGHIFVGDIRDRGLREIFHLSLVLSRLPPSETAAAVSRALRDSIAQEKELLVPPRFFAGLRGRIAGLAGVRVQLKRSAARNEMARFRFDAMLAIGAKEVSSTPLGEINVAAFDLAALERLVAAQGARAFAVRDMINARLLPEAALLWLLGPGETRSVGALLGMIAVTGIDPAAVVAMAPQHGLVVAVAPANSGTVSRFDAVFWPDGEPPPEAVWAFTCPASEKGGGLALSIHLRQRLDRRLVQALREHLAQHVSADRVPRRIQIVATLPD